MQTLEDRLKEVCAATRIGVYFSNAERTHGRPWIILKHRGLTLAEFFDPTDALAWLPEPIFTNRASAHSFESENHV